MTHTQHETHEREERPEEAVTIVPTQVLFRRGGGLEIAPDGSLSSIEDSGESSALLPGHRVQTYDITACLEPSNHDLHIHSRMNGVLHIDEKGKLSSVFGPSVHKFVPAETVATFLGTVTLEDGTAFTFDHNGRFYGLPNQTAAHAALPELGVAEDNVSVDIAKILTQVSISDVLDLIGWKPLIEHGPLLGGPCPLHQSPDTESLIFSVNLSENSFECREPGCCRGNPLELFAAVTETTMDEAAEAVCRQKGMDVPRRNDVDRNRE